MKKNAGAKIAVVSVALLLIVLTAIFAMSSNEEVLEGEREETNTQSEPMFSDVSVHDPSIIKDGDTFYAFGTHIEAAHSEDLMDWTTFTNGYTTPDNTLYGDLSENLSESFEWAGEDDADSQGGFAVWAPDIFWNENYLNEDGSRGAYMIYYSASSTYIRSAIGYAVSDNIEGPYEYVDTIMYSGFTEIESYDENSDVNKEWTNTNIPDLIENDELSEENPEWFHADGAYNNETYPNAIDANIFYDEDGKLWMTYGSWSGGIFLIEIDEETGQAIYPGEDGMTEDDRLIDRYFGVHIAGGYWKSGEGPYIVYDEERGYYYLYVTYGWLGEDGGYNMRVFRATNPQGPYVDPKEQGAVLLEDMENDPFGYKLIGNFELDTQINTQGSRAHGYVSPGHNSVYTDSETDQHFLAFHTRFPNMGEMHELRIHQMFMTEDDWPIVAPFRYGGETAKEIDSEELTGEYQFINHGTDNSDTVKSPESVTLENDGSITGSVEGTWEKTDEHEMELVMDGVTYQGILLQQWDDVSNQEVLTFTAMSNQNEAVWGIQLEDSSDEEIVSSVADNLTLSDFEVVSNLDLPSEGARNTSISWESSEPGIITSEGEVSRPLSGEEEIPVTLTATVKSGEANASTSFEVTVLPLLDAQLISHFSFEENLTDSVGEFEDATVTGDRIDNSGSSITYSDGVDGSAVVLDGESGIRLPDGLISVGDYTVSLWVHPDELTEYTTVFFGAEDEDAWVSIVPFGPEDGNTMVWSGSGTWYDAPTGLTIEAEEWTHLAYTVESGTITVYVDGEEMYSNTGFPNIFTSNDASFSLGVNWWDPPFKGMIDELRIYEGALESGEIAEIASR